MKKCSKCNLLLPIKDFKQRKDRNMAYYKKCIYCSSPKIIKIDIIENEKWIDIPGYEGYYQVSDLGRVKSLPRELWNGVSKYISTPRIMRQNENNKKYNFVTLYKNNNKKHLLVHLLVAMVFINHNTDKKKMIVVDHINNNPKDNRLSNLQIITTRENVTKDKKNTTSKYPGVYWCKTHKKWRVELNINNKKVFIGRFENEIKASISYKLAVENINNYTGKSNDFRNYIKEKLCLV